MIRTFFRKWHRWLAPVVFIQMFLWIVSGIFFSWNNFSRSLNESDPVIQNLTTEPKRFSSVQTDGHLTGVAAVLDSLKSNGIPVDRITSVKLGQFLDEPIAVVAYKDDFESYRYRLNPFRQLLGVTEAEALEAAQRKAGSEAVLEFTELKSDFDVFYPSFYYELPVYHFVFNHPEKGIIDCYVSPRTGDGLAYLTSKSRINRVMFSWFHIMEYSQSKSGRLWGYGLLMTFSLLMLGSLITGLPLYFKNWKNDRLNEEKNNQTRNDGNAVT